MVDVYNKAKDHQMPIDELDGAVTSVKKRFKEESSLWNCTEESLAILK